MRGTRERNALLDDKYIIIMLVVLRMSRAFMEFMRANYSAVARSTFKTSVVDASKA